jgi:hypothetical protein
MKNLKTLFIAMSLLMTFTFVGCYNRTVDSDGEIETSSNYTIKIIDGCEYIECDYGMNEYRVYTLTHKGNCKQCAARQYELIKKALKEEK